MGILDLIFPKYCVNCKKLGSYICADCFSFISFDISMICLVCNRPTINGLTHPGCQGKYIIDGCFSALEYKGIVKKLIYNFKYKPYLSDLGGFLVDLFYEAIIQNEIFIRTIKQCSNETIVFSPIPLHNGRLKRRGYNHAKLLADGLSKRLDVKLKDVLKRARETKSQFGLSLKERKENLKDAFSASPNILISQYPNIFLLDDILTTGSTLLEAGRTLKKQGAKKVWGLTLARD